MGQLLLLWVIFINLVGFWYPVGGFNWSKKYNNLNLGKFGSKGNILNVRIVGKGNGWFMSGVSSVNRTGNFLCVLLIL
jgi:hypothetical protein